jgi:hypothetical protein
MNISAVVLLSFVLFFAKPAVTKMQSLDAKDTFDAIGLSAKEVQEIVEEVEHSAYDSVAPIAVSAFKSGRQARHMYSVHCQPGGKTVSIYDFGTE